jgi:hypothetical protein
MSGWPEATPVPPPERPPTVTTPWGDVVHRGSDGLYDGSSYGALMDRCARFLEAGWRTGDDGIPYLQAGARRVLLWREPDGSWSVGHVGPGGPGVALAERVSLSLARSIGQAFARGSVAPQPRRSVA